MIHINSILSKLNLLNYNTFYISSRNFTNILTEDRYSSQYCCVADCKDIFHKNIVKKKNGKDEYSFSTSFFSKGCLLESKTEKIFFFIFLHLFFFLIPFRRKK